MASFKALARSGVQSKDMLGLLFSCAKNFGFILHIAICYNINVKSRKRGNNTKCWRDPHDRNHSDYCNARKNVH